MLEKVLPKTNHQEDLNQSDEAVGVARPTCQDHSPSQHGDKPPELRSDTARANELKQSDERHDKDKLQAMKQRQLIHENG